MKFISVLLAISLTAHAAPSDPGKVAIDFLEKVRLRKLDLEPGGDTALSAQTADEKKLQIARRLERMARDLGSDPLEVGEVRLDENFAAVLVRKIGGFDPGRLQVFPVALVKRGAEWMVAPVPASFENAGTGYAIELRKRLELLENWMLREQIVDLEKLRDDAAANMRRKIEAHLSIKELRSFSPEQATTRFLSACEQRDLPSLLGLLGGLAAKLPDDWAARLKAADHAISTASAVRPWRLLTAPEVIRVLVHDEITNDNHVVTIDCLDPARNGSSPPRIEFVQFELVKGPDDLWLINPPQSFLEESEDPAEEPDEDADADLLDAFPKKWSELHPPASFPTAELIYQALIHTLQNGNLPDILKLAKLEKNSQAARKSCVQAAQTWWAIHDPSVVRQAMPLAFKADETSAAALFQFFSARDPDQLDAKVMYFEHSPSGWLWTPAPARGISETFQAWIDAETLHGAEQWQQSLLKNCIQLDKLDNMEAPAEEDARKCVEAWLDAIRRGDLLSALSRTARLGDAQSGSIVLQNIGYEINSSRRSNLPSTITTIYQGKIWSAVGAETDSEGKSNYPLYPLIQTPGGARILIEIDLFASGNRGRDFLNRTALDRLRNSSSPAVADELRSLYASYQTHIESRGVKPSH